MTRPDRARAPELGRWVAAILRIGTVASVGMAALGYAWAVATGADGARGVPVIREIGDGGAAGLAAIGLLALTIVPLVMVAAATLAFVRAGERRMALVAATVGMLLLASLGIAAAVGAAI